MTVQFNSEPKSFQVKNYFGPLIAEVILPEKIFISLLTLSDKILSLGNRKSHGETLAGVINLEKKIFKSDFIDFDVYSFLDSCVRSYIIHCARIKGLYDNQSIIDSFINDAWVVSQYENEYNPIHNHRTCEVSSVIYLKTPMVKGRRRIESKKGLYENDGDINFFYSSTAQRDGDIFESGMVSIEPKEGMMLIFPSYLMHSVNPFIGPDERRSIAFNATFKIFNKDGVSEQKYVAGSKMGLNADYEFVDVE